MSNLRGSGRIVGGRASVGAILLLAAAACGGGSSSSVPLTAYQATLQPETPVLLFTPFSTFSPSLGYPIQIGDDGGNAQILTLVQFDLGVIPPGAVVTSARLRIHRTASIGNPLGLMPVRADHVDWALGSVVTPAHIHGQTLASDIGAFQFPTAQPVGEPPSATLTLTGQVAADVGAGRSASAYRLRGSSATNSNNTLDLWYIGGLFSGNGNTYTPELTIEYLAP